MRSSSRVRENSSERSSHKECFMKISFPTCQCHHQRRHRMLIWVMIVMIITCSLSSQWFPRGHQPEASAYGLGGNRTGASNSTPPRAYFLLISNCRRLNFGQELQLHSLGVLRFYKSKSASGGIGTLPRPDDPVKPSELSFFGSMCTRGTKQVRRIS